MFFNPLWLAVVALLLLAGVIVRQPALALVALLILLTWGGARLWSRHALRAVAYGRRLGATRVFRGETLTVETELVNWKPLPLAWVRVEEELPDALEPLGPRRNARGTLAGGLSHVTSAGPYQRVAWRTTLRCPERGAFAIGPTLLTSGDPFGFFRRFARVQRRDTVIVYPRIVPLADLGLPPRQVFGEARARRATLVDPLRPVGVRDYRPEDPLRQVHWKATARTQQLQVRVFAPSVVTQVAIFLNCDALDRPWYGLDPPEFERAIGVAASLAAHAADARHAFGVYSNRLVGGLGQPLRTGLGAGTPQLARALEGLARLSPFTLADFPPFLRSQARGLPAGSAIVVVTATLAPALAADLATLRARGHRVALIATAPLAEPPPRGIAVHRVAESSIDGSTPLEPSPLAGVNHA